MSMVSEERMSRRERILGKLGKLGSEALISAANLKREIEAQGLDRLESLARRLKLVKREEFESLQSAVRQIRENQEKILARLGVNESKRAPRAVGKRGDKSRRSNAKN